MDYRTEFYANYHMAVESKEIDSAHYEACVRHFLDRWRGWLPADKSSTMLDLACGHGEYLYFLGSLGYQNIVGVDLCEEELVCGRKMGLPNLICASALDYLENKDEEYDIISAFNLFEHLKKEEVLRLLKLVHGALRPGGKLLAVTPNGLSPFGGATRYWDFSHETGFTPASWRQLARLIGFRQVCFEEYGPIAHSLPGAARWLLWQLVRLGVQAVSYIEVGGPRDASRVYTADMKIILTK